MIKKLLPKKKHINPIYKLTDNAAFEAFEDCALILNLDNVTFTELNETASDILKATSGKNSVEQVAKILALEYEIDLEMARNDILDLYDDLLKQGVVEIVNDIKVEERWA